MDLSESLSLRVSHIGIRAGTDSSVTSSQTVLPKIEIKKLAESSLIWKKK